MKSKTPYKRIFFIMAVTFVVTVIAFFSIADIEYPWSKSLKLAKEIITDKYIGIADPDEIKSITVRVYKSGGGYDMPVVIEDEAGKHLFYDDLINSVSKLTKVHDDYCDCIPDIIVDIVTETSSCTINIIAMSPSGMVEFQTARQMQTVTMDTMWINRYLNHN
jgi:hypothetical protein